MVAGSPPLTLAQQMLNLRNNPLCAGTGGIRSGRLVWEFFAQPTPLSRTYRLRIMYALGEAPQVFVVDPDLTVLANGRKLPHVYTQKPTKLCLYLPKSGEWRSSKRLSETVVPWGILWLFYFEDWLATDYWKGGGVHPAPASTPATRTENMRRRLASQEPAGRSDKQQGI